MKHNTPDKDLIQAIAAGDAVAMASLYERYKTKTYQYIRGILKDPTLADDVVSEVFLCVWRKASEFRFESAVLTWILAIARNRALCAISSQKRCFVDSEEAEEIPDPSASPEDAVIFLDQQMQLRRAILRLSAKHREIINLVYYQSQSIAEVAEILSLAENTVKTRMFHARKQLEKLLGRNSRRKK
jgi:RNA polymerase sigma-70 factor, ECF subfamily